MVRKQKLTGHHYRRPSNKRTNVLFVCCLFFSSHLQCCRGDGDAKCRVCDNICQCLGKSANHNDSHEAFWLVRTDHVTWTLASDWSRLLSRVTSAHVMSLPCDQQSPLSGDIIMTRHRTQAPAARGEYSGEMIQALILCGNYAVDRNMRHSMIFHLVFLAKYSALVWSPANCPFPARLGDYLHDTRHRDIIRVMHGVTAAWQHDINITPDSINFQIAWQGMRQINFWERLE